MSRLTESPAWRALDAHRRQHAEQHLRDLFAHDGGRFARLSGEAAGLFVDYSKNRVTAETLELLFALARQQGMDGWIARLFAGDAVNHTERRPALHTALRNRSQRPVVVADRDVMPEVRRVLAQMGEFAERVRGGEWTGHTGQPVRDVVNIGIGGSDLGPQMVCAALEPYASESLNAHFVSNVDGAHLGALLKRLDPRTTLFVVASKTFTTEETLANAASARRWLIERLGEERAVARHFVAVSTNEAGVRAFGIDPANMFEFWDWVGGRYSLWSAIGLPIALYVGMERFEELLAGAHAMDEHFRAAPLEENLPVILGLLGVWYVNFLDAQTQAILPYDQSLCRFPAYLQQADMESNGKRVDRDGREVDYATAPVIWGEPGTNGQHAFFQLLHQGTRLVPADFIVAAESHYPLADHHPRLLANCLAQTEALMRGRTAEEAADEPPELRPYKVFPGNQPSTTILLPRLDPFRLGALIALYEHRIFAQAVIWNINPFDQWGVELGKRLAKTLLAEIRGDSAPAAHDGSTAGLLGRLAAPRAHGE